MMKTELSRPAPMTGAGRASGHPADDVETRIAELASLSRSDLAARWQTLFRTKPPKSISMRLMIGALAYAIQAKSHGGLKAVTRRRLEAPVETDVMQTRSRPAVPPALGTGTRLVREWNGTAHVVDVVEGGYLWNGHRHASLSAIAREITGARWSGPRFFGLNRAGTS